MGQSVSSEFSKRAINFRSSLVPTLNRATAQRDALTSEEVAQIAKERLEEAQSMGTTYTDPHARLAGFTRGQSQIEAKDKEARRDKQAQAAATAVPEMDQGLLDFMNKEPPVTQKYNTTLAVSADENSPPYDREAAMMKRRNKTVGGETKTYRPLPTERTSSKEPVTEKGFELGSGIMTGESVRILLLEHQNANPSDSDVKKLAALYSLPEEDIIILLSGLGVPVVLVDWKTEEENVSGQWHDVVNADKF